MLGGGCRRLEVRVQGPTRTERERLATFQQYNACMQSRNFMIPTDRLISRVFWLRQLLQCHALILGPGVVLR